jgi:hypothetical protein
MKKQIEVGDVVRESGADHPLTVTAIDGEIATCRYEEKGHAEADEHGMRTGEFPIASLIFVEKSKGTLFGIDPPEGPLMGTNAATAPAPTPEAMGEAVFPTKKRRKTHRA